MSLPLNLPNAITLGRIALVPIVVLAMLDARRGGSPPLAAGLFGALAASDALDGHLARARRSVTDFGKLVDPIADKVLVSAATVALVGHLARHPQPLQEPSFDSSGALRVAAAP